MCFSDVLDRVHYLGTEAEENHFPFSDYYEDFCLLMNVEKWLEVSSEEKLSIISAFEKGKAANKKAREG